MSAVVLPIRPDSAKEYPSDRPKLFAVHYIKWLMDSGAVQEIGPDALAVLVAVVMREDDTRYQRPVNFFNEQLAERCGIVSTHALIRARTRAVEAGLLNYDAGTKRNPGRYFVCGFHAQNAEHAEGIGRNAMRKTQGKRKESGRNPSTSIPNPIPIPKRERKQFVPPTFEQVKAYADARKSSVDPKRFWEFFDAGDWVDSNGKPVTSWKQKLLTWENHPASAKHEAKESLCELPLI